MRRVTFMLTGLMLVGSVASGLQSAGPIIAPAPPEASCARSIVACNATVNGTIEETDCKISSGVHSDVYSLEVPTKLGVTILMNSPEMDSHLTFREERALEPIRGWDNRPLPITLEDDNGGGGTNSRVATEAQGIWIVTAKGKKGGSKGPYTLTVKCEDLK